MKIKSLLLATTFVANGVWLPKHSKAFILGIKGGVSFTWT